MQAQPTTLFTTKSEAFAKYRAGYSKEAIDTILAPFANQTKITAVDVGAGTGIATRLLADQGAETIGVEPNASMIRAASPHPNMSFIQSDAESIPLEDDYADVVTSFHAFHWFDFKISLGEFNRILKPAGQLALVWNYWDVGDSFTFSYSRLIEEAALGNPDRVEPYAGVAGKIKKMNMRLLWKFQYLPFYKNVRRYTYSMKEDMDLQKLIGCARSQSSITHEGPVWDDLTEKIETLCSQNEPVRLAYSINVFTADPVKQDL